MGDMIGPVVHLAAVLLATSLPQTRFIADDSVAGLLHREDVQTELGLSPAQQKKWLEIDRPPKARVGGALEDDPVSVEDPDVRDKRDAEREKRAWSVLGPSQTVRLLQLVVQWLGPKALMRQDVQDSLGLTEDQRSEARRARAAYVMAVRDVIKRLNMKTTEFERPDPKKIRDRLAQIDKNLTDALDAIPNQDQRNQLAEMAGKKFVFAGRDR